MSAHSLKLAPTFFGLSMLLTACGRHDLAQVPSADAKLRKALTGTWTRGNDGSGFLSLASNGTYSASWYTRGSPTMVWDFEGSWTATGDVCMMTLARGRSWGTTNLQAEGTTERWRIIKVDEQHLVWESEGQTISLTREN